jgi:putative Ca2+/H+ antiporter (TMEM165/GDT1 family)
VVPDWLVAVLGSFVVVALAEMGDKTQLIAFALASRFRRPWPVMLGILVATTANHGLASAMGAWISATIPRAALSWALAVSFVAFGVWTLFPDKAEEPRDARRWGAFATTAIVFFFAEMGDKTQLATVALGARFASTLTVTLGTTLGMLVSDGLAVFAGTRLTTIIPMTAVRRIAATLFFLFGLLAALSAML